MSIDNNTLLLLVIVIFALIAIAGFWFFRRRAKVKVQGPLGTILKLNASSEPSAPPPAVKMSDATSRRGGLSAKDKTGRAVEFSRVEISRVEFSRVEVGRDMTAGSTFGKPDPKA